MIEDKNSQNIEGGGSNYCEICSQHHRQCENCLPKTHQNSSDSVNPVPTAPISNPLTANHNNIIDIEKGINNSGNLLWENNNGNAARADINGNDKNLSSISGANNVNLPSYCRGANDIGNPRNLSARHSDEYHKGKSIVRRATIVCRLAIVMISWSLLVVAATLLWYFMGWMYGVPALVVAIAAIVVSKVGWRWFYIAAVTAPRDITALIAYIKLLLLVKRYERKNLTLGDIFQLHVVEHPDKPAIIYENQEWSFRDLNEYSNRIANLFHSHGYKRGDIICLLLENRPEFVGVWLGLSKLGIITPLINTNQRGPPLLHSIKVANSVAMIYGSSFTEAIKEISKELPSTLSMYQLNNESHQSVDDIAQDLTTLLQSVPKDKIPSNVDKPGHHDKLVYIYTSGTTGLPKAAVITHSRYLFIAAAIHYTLKFDSADVFYDPLPLYHTAGGVMSMGQAIVFGSTVVIKKKFSASSYFPDCRKYGCTIGQYIGEMCRYILATPSSADDKSHKVRLMFGNGLRPQIWPRFIERFNISQIGEFYGATEGNANIVNTDNTVGAIGFVSRVLPRIYPISIIRANSDTGEPIRNENGLCQVCAPNEPGVFIGKIIKGNPSREFLGYVDKSASQKKIICDVFKKGDMAFLSGDLLISDERGYLYFVDRTGDTFRWKGENVSTGEVEAQISNVAGYKDSIVYGVEIPNTEGRGGMAAIYDPDNTIDLDEFSEGIKKLLPAYARPLFLRFLKKIDLTGTFKLRKVDLQKEGFNPNVITDDLYYLAPSGKYEKLTKECYDNILQNKIRF